MTYLGIGPSCQNNHAPVVDLGTGSAFNYVERTVQAMIDSDISITDIDIGTIESAVIELTNPQTDDAVQVGGSLPSGITSNIVGHTITLSSTTPKTKTLAEYETALQLCELKNERFSNDSIDPLNTTARTIEVTVNDGTQDSNTAVATGTIVTNLGYSATCTFPDDRPNAESNAWDPVNAFEDDAGTDPAEVGDGVANVTSDRTDISNEPLLETVSGDRPLLRSSGDFNNNALDFSDLGLGREISRTFSSYSPTYYVVAFGIDLLSNPVVFFTNRIFNSENTGGELEIRNITPFLAPSFIRVEINGTTADFDNITTSFQTVRLELDDGDAELFYDNVSQGTFTYTGTPTIDRFRHGRTAQISANVNIGRTGFLSSTSSMPTRAQIERLEKVVAAS